MVENFHVYGIINYSLIQLSKLFAQHTFASVWVCTYLQLSPSPTSTSHPPDDIIHVMNAPRPSPFFAALSLPYIKCKQKSKKKMGEAWKGGY